jgi:hypothetical protein
MRGECLIWLRVDNNVWIDNIERKVKRVLKIDEYI